MVARVRVEPGHRLEILRFRKRASERDDLRLDSVAFGFETIEFVATRLDHPETLNRPRHGAIIASKAEQGILVLQPLRPFAPRFDADTSIADERDVGWTNGNRANACLFIEYDWFAPHDPGN